MSAQNQSAGKIRRQLLRTLNILTDGTDAPLARSLRASVLAFHRAALVWTGGPGVQGFGIGPRSTAGRCTGDLALKVYVERKLARADCTAPIPEYVTIPGASDAVQVDVEAIGRMKLHYHVDRARPLRPGISIGRAGGAAGTIGCLARRRALPGVIGVLGSAHVLVEGARTGTALLQPAEGDGGKAPGDQIATLSGWAPLELSRGGYPNRVDAAFGALAIGQEPPDEFDLELLPVAVGAGLRRGMRVRKIGRTTGETTGFVRDIDFRFAVPVPCPGGGPARRIGFREQVLCSFFAAPGDSGAGVLDDSGAIVGLHIAGSQSASVFSRIASVCDALDVDIVTRAH